ncbi:MAG: serine/threonine-protein kinase, partial [Planctomycetia bacterium]
MSTGRQPADGLNPLGVFLRCLESSGLLEAEDLVDVKRRTVQLGAQAQPPALAAELVQKKLLTRWQATQLVAGQSAFLIGAYRLVDVIGSGSMGTVYLATNPNFPAPIALKVLSAQLSNDPQSLTRFQREMQALMSLSHPNIIAAYEGNCVGRRYFLAMEYLKGRDLKHWLHGEGKLAIPLACDYVRQAALGLEFAHQKGLVHRDVKTANLFVSWPDSNQRPIVKILDLGLASFQSAELQPTDGLRLTTEGQLIGTPDYMAPEQARNPNDSSVRSDVYGLGVVLFELLTGSLPFEGKNLFLKMMARIENEA